MITKYVVWDEDRGFSQSDLAAAKHIIKSGGLVAFPTETVYGLGGDALHEEAAKKIYEAKGRPSDNPLILHISNKDLVSLYVEEVSAKARELMDTFWPGPLTLIFKKNERIPYATTGGLDTVAIRMPSHSGARAFLEAAGTPVAAPSANTSGRPSPTDATHVKEDLDGKVEMIIDGGKVGIGIESTIIDTTGDIPTILRPGTITMEMVEAVIGKTAMDQGLKEDSEERPKAPGMKYRHYAPEAEMVIVDGTKEEVIKKINDLVSGHQGEKIGILATEETKSSYVQGCVVCMGSSKKGTLTRELYRAIREFDHLGVKKIYSESFRDEADAEAIMNRLKKAAGHNIITI